MNKLVINRNCGFFSDFLTSLAGIMYFYDENKKFYVEWINSMYSNTPNDNLYNKFFNQIYDYEDITNVYHNVTPYGYFFPDAIGSNIDDLDVYNNLKKPYEILHNLNILDSPFIRNIDKNYFQDLRVLGVHKRGTDHHKHGAILPDDFFIKKVKNELKNNTYDKIFLITDEYNSLELFKKEFGDMLLYTDSVKSKTNEALHMSSFEDRYKLACDVVTDAVLLSLTNYKLITRSNVSTFSLLCNLDKNFKCLDKHIQYN